jgi:HD-GYP domain-containing protein (c-di-GMP phosphodiesterase class II)
MRLVVVERLKPGMQLAEDIVRMDGNAVIIHYKKNDILDQKMCDTMLKLHFDSVMIQDERFSRVVPPVLLSIELRETLYGMLSSLLKQIEKKPKTVTRESFTRFYPHIRDMVYEFRDVAVFSPIASLKKQTEFIADHAINTAILAAGIGKKLKFSSDMLEKTLFSALFHDIGMLFLPTSLYSERKVFTEHERIDLARHTELGFEFVQSFNLSGIGALAAYTVLRHHERVDGSGYPGGRAHVDINKATQVCGIADYYCALISERPYRHAYSRYEALKMFIERNTAFSSEVRTACLDSVVVFPNGSEVILNTKEHAIVLSQTTNYYKPIIGIFDSGDRINEVSLITDTKRRIDDCSI